MKEQQIDTTNAPAWFPCDEPEEQFWGIWSCNGWACRFLASDKTDASYIYAWRTPEDAAGCLIHRTRDWVPRERQIKKLPSTHDLPLGQVEERIAATGGRKYSTAILGIAICDKEGHVLEWRTLV